MFRYHFLTHTWIAQLVPSDGNGKRIYVHVQTTRRVFGTAISPNARWTRYGLHEFVMQRVPPHNNPACRDIGTFTLRYQREVCCMYKVASGQTHPPSADWSSPFVYTTGQFRAGIYEMTTTCLAALTLRGRPANPTYRPSHATAALREQPGSCRQPQALRWCSNLCPSPSSRGGV